MLPQGWWDDGTGRPATQNGSCSQTWCVLIHGTLRLNHENHVVRGFARTILALLLDYEHRAQRGMHSPPHTTMVVPIHYKQSWPSLRGPLSSLHHHHLPVSLFSPLPAHPWYPWSNLPGSSTVRSGENIFRLPPLFFFQLHWGMIGIQLVFKNLDITNMHSLVSSDIRVFCVIIATGQGINLSLTAKVSLCLCFTFLLW